MLQGYFSSAALFLSPADHWDSPAARSVGQVDRTGPIRGTVPPRDQ